MFDESLAVGLVQEQWTPDPIEHCARLEAGIAKAAKMGAQLVCLQELTLSPYFCTKSDVDASIYKEDLHQGPTATFISRVARQYQVYITASLFEDEGFNTAVAFNAQGEFIASTRKQHIPSGEKYHENYYFKPGDSNYPVHSFLGHRFGLPTCYDQWFPELSRIYGLQSTEVLIYPTAIGSEPTAPDINTQPMWQQVMVAQGIMNNLFVIAVNRVGIEDGLNFYGSSFISDPMGNILAQAPRDEPSVIVAQLDFSLKALWGRLFPFNQQRQVESYQALLK